MPTLKSKFIDLNKRMLRSNVDLTKMYEYLNRYDLRFDLIRAFAYKFGDRVVNVELLDGFGNVLAEGKIDFSTRDAMQKSYATNFGWRVKYDTYPAQIRIKNTDKTVVEVDVPVLYDGLVAQDEKPYDDALENNLEYPSPLLRKQRNKVGLVRSVIDFVYDPAVEVVHGPCLLDLCDTLSVAQSTIRSTQNFTSILTLLEALDSKDEVVVQDKAGDEDFNPKNLDTLIDICWNGSLHQFSLRQAEGFFSWPNKDEYRHPMTAYTYLGILVWYALKFGKAEASLAGKGDAYAVYISKIPEVEKAFSKITNGNGIRLEGSRIVIDLEGEPSDPRSKLRSQVFEDLGEVWLRQNTIEWFDAENMYSDDTIKLLAAVKATPADKDPNSTELVICTNGAQYDFYTDEPGLGSTYNCGQFAAVMDILAYNGTVMKGKSVLGAMLFIFFMTCNTSNLFPATAEGEVKSTEFIFKPLSAGKVVAGNTYFDYNPYKENKNVCNIVAFGTPNSKYTIRRLDKKYGTSHFVLGENGANGLCVYDSIGGRSEKHLCDYANDGSAQYTLNVGVVQGNVISSALGLDTDYKVVQLV